MHGNGRTLPVRKDNRPLGHPRGSELGHPKGGRERGREPPDTVGELAWFPGRDTLPVRQLELQDCEIAQLALLKNLGRGGLQSLEHESELVEVQIGEGQAAEVFPRGAVSLGPGERMILRQMWEEVTEQTRCVPGRDLREIEVLLSAKSMSTGSRISPRTSTLDGLTSVCK